MVFKMIIRCGEYAQMEGITTGLFNVKTPPPICNSKRKKKYSSFRSKHISSE